MLHYMKILIYRTTSTLGQNMIKLSFFHLKSTKTGRSSHSARYVTFCARYVTNQMATHTRRINNLKIDYGHKTEP